MNNWMRIGIMAGILTIGLGSRLASAEDVHSKQYKINMAAWADITLNDLFGSEGWSISRFINHLSGSVPDNPDDAKILGALRAAKAWVEKNPKVKDWYVKDLFTADAHANVDLKELAALLDSVELAGLSVPCTHIWMRKTDKDFLGLLSDPAFLLRLGRLTFPDFYSIPMTHPLLTDEHINLIQEGIRAGLFGYFTLYANQEKDSPVVSLSSLGNPDVQVKAVNQCCSQISNTCVTGLPGNLCTMCGSVCCAPSTKCR